MYSKKLLRLRVVLSALLVLGMLLTACQSPATPTTAPEGKPEAAPTEAVKEPGLRDATSGRG